jgi:hypothetical protein
MAFAQTPAARDDARRAQARAPHPHEVTPAATGRAQFEINHRETAPRDVEAKVLSLVGSQQHPIR